MIGNNSCGVHSVTAGRTADNVESLEIVTGDGIRMHVGATSDAEYERIVQAGGRPGEIYAALRRLRDRYADMIRARYPDIPRRVSGYGLDQLLPEHGFHVARALVGTEGTCVTVLEATVRLVHRPQAHALLVLAFDDVFAAADAVPAVLDTAPAAIEGIDSQLVDDARRQHLHRHALSLLPDGGGWLLVEYGAASIEAARHKAEEAQRRLSAAVSSTGATVLDDARQHDMWLVRESGLGATAHVPGRPLTWEGWEDAAVPPAALGAYLRKFRALLDRFGYHGDLYGHFGDGCVHTRIDFDFRTPEGRRTYRRFLDEATALVVRHGGSLSGEHGDGQSRAALLPKMFGPALVEAFREFKRIWDPDGRMNPGKKVDAYAPDANLRLASPEPSEAPRTHFAYPADDGDFPKAILRCVGVGACRKTDTGTMCPSYMVTRDEEHATRGRSRLLWEMLRGDVVQGGWRSEPVREALDLCLACKGCKGECPVSVDMATWKAEFLSHYYEGRWRPRSAYAFGLVARWARLGSRLPWTSRLIARNPVGGALLKRAAGIGADRRIPAFAAGTFRERFARRRPPHDASRPRVVLWPDTFNDHFEPWTAEAAVEVLEEVGGYRVEVPAGAFCCGRPLYDFGMLDTARRWLAHTMDVLEPARRDRLPIVVLEPSCASVFTDELGNLFPDDPRAAQIASQVTTLGELLESRPPPALPHLDAHAVLHGHCHRKALGDTDDDVRLLGRIGIDTEVLDSGCCGMAGAFGFEAHHVDLSRAIGERVLLPRVRHARPTTIVMADGFSCREQVSQETGRRALHLAEVLQLARHPEWLVPGHPPERAFDARRRPPRLPGAGEAGLLSVAALALVAGGVGLARALGSRDGD